ncbi:MAG TPA: 16S rRNA (guanine(527)-N(7))-methyltransferase RsmG [Chitinophagaceae bacterium]
MEVILKYFDDFTSLQLQQFAALEELYADWNKKINVISRKDIEALYEKHILHSLSIAAVIDFQPGTEIIDIGTGGGFPGVPLAIFFPEVQFHLVDSIGKKIKVVQAVADALQLKNISAEQARVETIQSRKFDFAISRAVASLKELCKWSKPLIKKGAGQDLSNGLISLKGGNLHQEIADSGCRPRMIELYKIFPQEYFQEKYLLHVAL